MPRLQFAVPGDRWNYAMNSSQKRYQVTQTMTLLYRDLMFLTRVHIFCEINLMFFDSSPYFLTRELESKNIKSR